MEELTRPGRDVLIFKVAKKVSDEEYTQELRAQKIASPDTSMRSNYVSLRATDTETEIEIIATPHKNSFGTWQANLMAIFTVTGDVEAKNKAYPPPEVLKEAKIEARVRKIEDLIEEKFKQLFVENVAMRDEIRQLKDAIKSHMSIKVSEKKSIPPPAKTEPVAVSPVKTEPIALKSGNGNDQLTIDEILGIDSDFKSTEVP